MSSIIRSLIVLIGFSFRGRFVCLDEMDTERSMRQVLNFKNKKAVPQHCSNSYRESGLVQHHLFHAGIPMGCHYNQVHTVLLSLIGDGLGRPVRLYGFRLDFDALGREAGLDSCKIFP